MMKKLVMCALFLFVLSACGGGGGDDSSSANGCGVLNARVFGGESCNQSARSPVVAIVPVVSNGQTVSEFGICTGTLITLDDVLTSAHCFLDPILNARQAGLEIVAFVALVGGENGEVLSIVNAAFHPFYDGNAGSRFDVAMATISKVPTPPIGPLPLLISEITGPGSNITAFGYGTNEQGIGLLKAADFEVTAIEGGNLIVIGDGASSICPGDSGGPAAYQTREGISTLAGINSFGDVSSEACRSTAAAFFGFVDIQNDSILDFIFDYAPDAAVG